MSIKSTKAYVEGLKTDEKFRKQVPNAEDQDTQSTLVQNAGYDFKGGELNTAIATGAISNNLSFG